MPLRNKEKKILQLQVFFIIITIRLPVKISGSRTVFKELIYFYDRSNKNKIMGFTKREKNIFSYDL
jgi:hypothetical protein